jgi:hypothetical protein
MSGMALPGLGGGGGSMGGLPGMTGGGLPGMSGGGLPGMAGGGGIGLGGGAILVTDPNRYFVYNRGSAKLVIGIEPGGSVESVAISGGSAPTITTSKGIGLGAGLRAVIDKHGYPEATENVAGLLVVRYPDQGVVFSLRGLRVTSITIGVDDPIWVQ